MTLRSRKPGGREAQARKADVERFAARADRPLRTLHVQTEAFNLMWRDFLFKMSCGAVAYACFLGFSHRGSVDFLVFDALSVAFYALSAGWIRKQQSSFDNFSRDRLFRASMAVLASQLAVSAMSVRERGSLHKEFAPVAIFYLAIVVTALFFMRNNATLIKEGRDDLASTSHASDSKHI